MSVDKNSINDYTSTKPNVNALISDATKRSFLTSVDSDFSNLSSTTVDGKPNIGHKSSYVPLLPRRHLDDLPDENNLIKQPVTRLKWNDIDAHVKEPIVIHSYDSSSAVSSTTLLSKVDVDEDIEFDEITPSSSWKSKQLENSNVASHCFSLESDENKSLTSNSFTDVLPQQSIKSSVDVDYAGAGDMTYVTHAKKMQPSVNKSREGFLQLAESKAKSMSLSSSLKSNSTINSSSSVQTSYVVNEPNFSSMDSARAAGYPVISTHSDQINLLNRQSCKESAVFDIKSGNQSVLKEETVAELPKKELPLPPAKENTIQSLIEENVKLISWKDSHEYNAVAKQKRDMLKSMSRSQVSERYNQLKHGLEIVHSSSLKCNQVNRGDIFKAVELLKNSKLDSINSKKIEASTAGECSPRHSSIELQRKKKSLNESSTGTLVLSGPNDHSSEVSNKTYSKSGIVAIGPLSPNYNPFQQSADSSLVRKIAFEETDQKLTRSTNQSKHPERNSQVNLINVGTEKNSTLTSPPHEMSYDTFSTNVKTSSCFSTPSKTPTQQLSPKNDSAVDKENELKPTGFMILDEKTPPGKLAKKKEQFLRGRLKKEEEYRKIQMEKEMEAERKKLEAKQQQERALQKKQEEKEKRNKIFKDYQRRKRKEETAALRNPGVIGSNSPSSFGKRSPLSRNISLSTDRLHMLGRMGSKGNISGSQLTVPSSARVINHINSYHPHGLEEDSDSLGSGGSLEYTGPKLFKQLKSKSNRGLITNAINHCCLSGKVNEKARNKTLKALEDCEARHLMVLFRDNNCQYRALYSYQPAEEKLFKICGNGPNFINPSMIEALFKYNSGRRAFSCVPSKTLSVSIDGITIKSSLWHQASKK